MNTVKCYQLADVLTACFSVIRQWQLQHSVKYRQIHLSMQEPAEKLTDNCIYSRKHYFIPYRHADLTWHGTHQFHKEIWAFAFEHRVVLLIQHNHNVSCLIARLLQAWELLGAVMTARLTCGFKSWTNTWVQNMVQIQQSRQWIEFKTQQEITNWNYMWNDQCSWML